jgi:hypothetical protein
MSIATVQQFLDHVHQLEARGESAAAEVYARDQLEDMIFLAHGRPDLIKGLEALKRRYDGNKPPEPPRPTPDPVPDPVPDPTPDPKPDPTPDPPSDPPIPAPGVPQVTYAQFVSWAREMEAEGRLEYALRFLEMAGSMHSLDTTDALLAKDLKKRIDAAERAGGYEEATVLVVGQPSSGKSVMLGALWRFLNSHGDLASVSINNSHRESIREFYDRVMDDKMDSGVFPPGTPPRFYEPIAEFVVDIEPRKMKTSWLKASKTLPKVRLRLVDIAGEQFNSMGDFSSGEVDPFVTNFLYTNPNRIMILFVIDKDVVTRNQAHKVDRYFTLVRNYMQTKGMDPSQMGNRVGLVFTKWDKHVEGVEQDPTIFVERFPSSKNIFPDSGDPRIFTFTVGNEYSRAERERLKRDFDWDPTKAEVLARRLYRSVAGIADDPWVNKK